MKSISVVINTRLNSTRLPKKIVLPFLNTTLIDIALEKINVMNFFDFRFLAVYEEELKDKVNKYKNVKIINRTQKEVETGIVNLKDRFAYFKNIPTDYIFLLNPCCPLVSVKTIKKAHDYFQNTNFKSYTSVVETRDWIFNLNSDCITRKDYNNVATNKGELFYKATHMFHIINKERFFNENLLWTFNKDDPHCIKVNEDEEADVDDLKTFLIAEFLYKRKYFNE